jgi:hypothetical protein
MGDLAWKIVSPLLKTDELRFSANQTCVPILTILYSIPLYSKLGKDISAFS